LFISVLGFTHVVQTTPGSKPENGIESAIWSFNLDTKRLTRIFQSYLFIFISKLSLQAHWINLDGTKPETIIEYDIRENEFVITGDIAQWEHEHSDYFISPVVSHAVC
jgi:hypothetical protein